MENEASFGIYVEHPHYSTAEVFEPQSKLIRGFIEKNYNKMLHSQEFYEINIVLSGKANHYIGKRKITVSKGDTFIIPPDVMHGYDGSDGFDVYHILINPKYLEKSSADLQLLRAFPSLFRIDPLMREKTSAKLHFCLTNEEISALIPRLNNLTEHSSKNGVADSIIANSEAMIIITTICDMYERHSGGSIEPATEDTSFFSSISYLYENLSAKLNIEALAHVAHMSRNSYIAKFKRITGQPPAKFIKKLKIDTAKQMLSETSLSEAEIAAAIGCTDTSHLIKIFKESTGITPSAYRKTQ